MQQHRILTRRLMFLAGFLALVVTLMPQGSIQAASRHAPFFVQAPVPGTPYNSDWTSYLGNATNSSYNVDETAFGTAAASSLALSGVVNIGDGSLFTHAIATSVLRSNGVLYFGSWDGYEYAVDAHSYHLRWKQFLGINTAPAAQGCYPNSIGISSNGTIASGALFLGGGDGNLYALNAATGAIIWKTPIATPPNEYLWGSPVVGNGHVYMGTASLGDCPLIQAKLAMLDQTTGTITAQHYTVDTTNAQNIGNSIWSKPVLDSVTGTVTFVTGNGTPDSAESQAIVQLNWNTLAVKSIWKVPQNQVGGDSDFGASCMVVPNVGGGNRGVICHNKNGHLYAVNSAGTLSWSVQLGMGGDSPEYDQGDITAGTFDGHSIYYATTRVVIGGVTYQSAVYRLDPATGAIQWVLPIALGFPLTATAGAGNVLVVALANNDPKAASNLLVLSMKNGSVLFNYPLPTSIYGTPTISRNMIYVPTLDGHVYIFSPQIAIPTGDAFTGTTLGAQWTWVNQDATHERLTGTALQIDSAGQYNIYAKNFLTEPAVAGDFALTSQISFNPTSQYMEVAIAAYQDKTHFVKLDLINTGTPAAPREMFEITATNGTSYNVGQLANSFDLTKPFYLQLTRVGSVFYGFVSADKAHWQRVGVVSPAITPTVMGLSVFYNQAPLQTAQFYSCILTSI